MLRFLMKKFCKAFPWLLVGIALAFATTDNGNGNDDEDEDEDETQDDDETEEKRTPEGEPIAPPDSPNPITV